MDIISLEQADHLYWLGRYTERVYTTLNIFAKRFDALIDGAINSYEDFCKSIDIPNLYADKADFVKRYSFDTEIQIGDKLVFEDMAIYSMVKNNTFNGIPLPNICAMDENGDCRLIKRFGYEDFKGRLS